MMRFFTAEWFSGDMTDAEYERTIQKYADHIEIVRNALPFRLTQFIDDVSLHDALVRRATLRAEAFQLQLRAGDLQKGYCALTLLYGDIVAVLGRPSINDILDDEFPEIVEDEIDVADLGVFEHRLLFAPDGELVVQFRSFDFSSFPVADRYFARERSPFVRL